MYLLDFSLLHAYEPEVYGELVKEGVLKYPVEFVVWLEELYLLDFSLLHACVPEVYGELLREGVLKYPVEFVV